jgi:hypothetical protein
MNSSHVMDKSAAIARPRLGLVARKTAPAEAPSNAPVSGKKMAAWPGVAVLPLMGNTVRNCNAVRKRFVI